MDDHSLMRPLSRPGVRAGYSLVEVLIAATVLMAGVCGTLITNVASWNLTRTAEETKLVTIALSEAVERLRLLEPEEVTTTFPESAPLPDLDAALTELAIVPTYPGYAAGDGAITIQLRATWRTFDGQTRTVQFTTAV